MSALETEEGDKNYSDFEVQPTEFVLKNEEYLHPTDAMLLNNVLKYIVRHRDRAGEEDLDKAIHYLQMVKEHTYNES